MARRGSALLRGPITVKLQHAVRSRSLSPAARANRKCAPQPSVQGPCGSLFGDFQDMYLDFNRFISIGAVVSSPSVDRGVVYFGSMDGNLYALQ